MSVTCLHVRNLSVSQQGAIQLYVCNPSVSQQQGARGLHVCDLSVSPQGARGLQEDRGRRRDQDLPFELRGELV